jgi:hypothetical protein
MSLFAVIPSVVVVQWFQGSVAAIDVTLAIAPHAPISNELKRETTMKKQHLPFSI